MRPIVLAALVGLLATACNASPTPQTHGALYLFTSRLSSAGLSATAYALGLSMGKPLWQFPLNGAVDGAARAGDTLYVGGVRADSSGTPTGTLTALFASTGQVHWRLTDPFGRSVPLAASADAVYTQIANTLSAPPGITLERRRANDGDPLWSVVQSASANPLATVGDSALYLVTANQTTATVTTPLAYALVAVSINDGKTLWHLALRSPPTMGSAPLLNGDVLYLAEQPAAAPSQGSPPTRSIVAVRASDGRVLWHTTLPGAGAAGNLVVGNGLVCFGYESVSGSVAISQPCTPPTAASLGTSPSQACRRSSSRLATAWSTPRTRAHLV